MHALATDSRLDLTLVISLFLAVLKTFPLGVTFRVRLGLGLALYYASGFGLAFWLGVSIKGLR